MRASAVAIGLLVAGLFGSPSHADPYRWCAEYGGFRGGGATNCYFMTLQQCRAAVSGVGGFCRPNTFYTGPERRPRRSHRSSG